MRVRLAVLTREKNIKIVISTGLERLGQNVVVPEVVVPISGVSFQAVFDTSL